jgi:glycosyltransferase involved in cell wall biosynthesis
MSRLPCQPGKGRAGFGGSDGLSEKSGDGVASKSNDLEISVIVPVRPGEIQLNRCLTALFDALPSTSQVIVVGDGYVPEILPDPPEDTTLSVLSISKAGPAACRDFGARHADGDWLCFVDSDVLVHKDAFKRSISFLRMSGDDGLVGSYDDKPEADAIVSKFRNLLHHYHHSINSGAKGVFWGAFGFVRRSAYFASGGFDPVYSQPSVEDIELGYRLAENGYHIVLVPEVQVTHLKRWTFPAMVKVDVFLRAKLWTMLLHNYRYRYFGALNTSLRERASALITASGALLFSGSVLGWLPFYPFAVSCLLFITVQRRFYSFLTPRIGIVRMPMGLLLHQIYFMSAITGWLLGQAGIFKGWISKRRHVVRAS